MTNAQNLIITCIHGLWTDYKIDNEHTQHIRQHYRRLLEQMDVKDSTLLAELFMMNVIDQRDKEELESIANSTCRIERLLSMLSKTSSDQWEQFLMALETTGQRHLADMIRGKQTEDRPGWIYICSLVHTHRSHIISSTIWYRLIRKGNHRSKKAKIKGMYLAPNTLLGLFIARHTFAICVTLKFVVYLSRLTRYSRFWIRNSLCR